MIRKAGVRMEERLRERLRDFGRGCVEIDLDAIVSNMRRMREGLPSKTLMTAVVKADGYGHGSAAVAQVLESLEFLYGYAVATAEEAHTLRQAGIRKPILILGYAFPDSYEQLVREEVRPAVFRRDMVRELSLAAQRVGRRAKVHVKVDTGMNRIGIAPDEEGFAFVKELAEEKWIEIEGIFTHFARADETDKAASEAQYALFTEFTGRLERELHLRIPLRHCANSAAILGLPCMGLDMVRAGIALYGLNPSSQVRADRAGLTPALSLYSHIVYIKTIKSGQSVSYGGVFTAAGDMRVATIPIGYGDGYPRGLSGKGHVLIRGKRAVILGRVCMDQFVVDVTEIPEAAEGDPVTLVGYDGEEHISAELLGELSGRFNYELVCCLNGRLPRVWLKDGRPFCFEEKGYMG